MENKEIGQSEKGIILNQSESFERNDLGKKYFVEFLIEILTSEINPSFSFWDYLRSIES